MEIINPKLIKEEKRIGRKPKYTDEYYMMMAKEVIEEGLTYRQAAGRYKCSHGTVNHWTKLYRQGKLVQRAQKTKTDCRKVEAELQRQDRYIKELKAQVGELYLENQLLKKAQLHFQHPKNGRSSVITSENFEQFQEGVES